MIVYRNQETIDILLEKAFCDGYEYAQKEYAKINLGAGFREFGRKMKNTATNTAKNGINKVKQGVKEDMKGIKNLPNRITNGIKQRVKNIKDGDFALAII